MFSHSVVAGDEYQGAILAYRLFLAALSLFVLWLVVLEDEDE